MIAITTNKTHQIFLGPLVEKQIITVFTLGYRPFIERLGHYHQTHFIAKFHLPRSRNIMCRANSIAAHLFHDEQLTPQSGFIDSRTQRAEVMMQADAFEFTRNTIEDKPFFGRNLDTTHAKTGRIFIEQFTVFFHRNHCRIKRRRFGRP